MPSPLALRRIQLFESARSDPDFLGLDPGALRFTLRTSLADVAVPVEVPAETRSIVRGAAGEIALLLATHHRSFVPADDRDRLILREDYARLPSVPDLLGPSGGGPDLRGAALLGPALHPALTGGVVNAWIDRGGRGRSLVALFIELLRRALAEEAATRGREPTPLLVALALGGELQAVDVREALPGPPVDRYLRAAALAALWLAARTGVARAFRDAGRPPDDPLLARIEAFLAPGSLLGGRVGVSAGGVVLYGCELAAGLPRAEDLAARLAAGAGAEGVAGELAGLVAADDELARRAEQAVAVARLREALGAAVGAGEASGHGGSLAAHRALLAAPGALATAAADEPGRRALAERLSDASEVRGTLEPVAKLLRAWRQKEPAQAFGLRRDHARREYATAATALLCDLALERRTASTRRMLSFRTGREAEGGADREWEAGRLYRLSPRPGPILCPSVDRPVGHLFADVKDFTRRTALLGQASMAELLRREFYGPIVVLAKEHFGGMQHLADRGGVSLNNLLGDAVSFTGPIQAMVSLAKGIRATFASYQARLAREISSDLVAGQIAEIERLHAAGVAAAGAARAEAEAALAREAPGTARHAALAARAARARSEQARLGAERERALARARGEGLEAGTFISHGPAPLVIAIEDEVFGRNRVAIAEKLNESARGTARAPAARARADAALERERARSGNPGLVHAWSVFIGQPLALPVPPEIEAQALRLLGAGDAAGAMRALAGPVREGLEAAAREGDDRAGDIYNSGAALSEDALEAYLEEVARARESRRVTLGPEEIPPALRARWFFGDEPQELVVSFEPGGARVAELFRRVGQAAFKGLGRVVVWELCAAHGAPGALAEALGVRWYRG